MKTTKKILVLTALMLFAFCINAGADEKTETLTFEWEQTSVEYLTQWEMHWGNAAGGPYESLVVLPYNAGDPAGTFSSPVEAVVTGQPATTETRYFVLRACGDVPIDAGQTEYQCSDFSNEVSYNFWIPVAGKFSVPIQFRIKAQ